MKNLILVLMIFCSIFPGLTFAKFSKEQTVTLLKASEKTEAIGSTEKLFSKVDNITLKTNLVGKLRVISVPNNPTIIQIVWTGICLKNDETQRVAFEQPMTSIFKGNKSLLNQKPQIPIEGEYAVLKKAFDQLLKGKVDKEDLKKKRVAKNPIFSGRNLFVKNAIDDKINDNNLNLDGKFKRKNGSIGTESSQGSKNQGPTLESDEKVKNKNLIAGKDKGTDTFNTNDVNHSNNMMNASKRRPDQNNLAPDNLNLQVADAPNVNNRVMIQQPNAEAPQLLNAGALLHRNQAQQQADIGNFQNPGNGLAQNLPGIIGNNRRNNQGDENVQNVPALAIQHPLNAGALRRNQQQPEIGNLQGNLLPERVPERAAIVNPNENRQAQNQNNPGAELALQGGRNNQFNIGDAAPIQQPQQEEEQREPEITYQVTENGCRPRIDRIHERVIMQNRTKRLEDGVVRDEGECTDSLEIYPIMKDFLCDGCTDVVNGDERRAYSRFQEFWFDRENHKQIIGETLYPDLGRPYLFADETGSCEPLVNLQAGTVHRQVETVYYNFNNTRVVVEGCHQAPNQNPIMIQQTADGCRFSHDFARNISHEQKKSIYTLDGITREVVPCRPVGDPIQHEFFPSDCQAVSNLANNTVTNMVKRRIRTETGNKIISRECEPEQTSNLLSTSEECQGQYLHDLTTGRSYLKKAYFYNQGGARKFVSPCVRSNDFIAHQSEIKAWTNDDGTRISRPHIEYFINTSQGRLTVDIARVRGDLGMVNYTYLRNEHRPNGNVYFDGCYRRTRTNNLNIYQRGDGSVYEHHIGEGNVIASGVDECTRRVESQTVLLRHRGGNFFRHSKNWYGRENRVVTTYPNGAEVAGGWYSTGEEWSD